MKWALFSNKNCFLETNERKNKDLINFEALEFYIQIKNGLHTFIFK